MKLRDYIQASVNFDIPDIVADSICENRGLDSCCKTECISVREKELCKADLYMWICTSPSRKGAVSDGDNSWSHSDGGFTLTDADKRALRKLANDIYTKWDEPVAKNNRTTFKIVGVGERVERDRYKVCRSL